MADVYFSKTEVVISQPLIEICRRNLVCWWLWPSEGSSINKCETGNSIERPRSPSW